MGALPNVRITVGYARFVVAFSTCLFFALAEARAVTVPFTEEFQNDSANWRNNNSITPLTWNAGGGPDGSTYASATFNFAGSGAGGTPAIIRGHDEFNSSGGAFVGNWITSSVAGFGVYVRHNTGVPLTFFVRFADPVNFPGAVKVVSTPVASGQWTSIQFPIPDPDFVYEGPPFPDVFDNIGHVQIGVIVPSSLAGVNQDFAFDIDKVSLSAATVPAVSEWGMVVTALLVMTAGTLLLQRARAGQGCPAAAL
jgi:hypothetical protein